MKLGNQQSLSYFATIYILNVYMQVLNVYMQAFLKFKLSLLYSPDATEAKECHFNHKKSFIP
jgi:hypothetical protein